MDFFSLLYLAAMLCVSCSKEIVANSMPSNAKTLNRNVQQEIHVENMIGRTTLADVDEDVLFLIIEQLDSMDLINLASSHARLASIAFDIFRRQYSDMEIWQTFSMDQKACGKCIHFDNVPDIVATLKHFGRAIKKITVHSRDIENNKLMAIFECINEYASELIHFDLGALQTDTFRKFTIPFNKVEILDFVVDGWIKSVAPFSLPLNQIFPKLNRLILRLQAGLDYNFLDSEFSHLEDLYLSICSDALERQNEIGRFLLKNKQIRSFTSDYFIDDYARLLNQYLPNTQNLSVPFSLHPNEDIRFEHIKHFKLMDYRARSLEKVSFAQIESLEMFYELQFRNHWIEFARRHSNLKRLNIVFNPLEGHSGLLEMAAELPDLVEITARFYKNINVAVINQLVDSHEKLWKITFLHNGLDQNEIDLIRQHFENTWTISNATTFLIFEKKQ